MSDHKFALWCFGIIFGFAVLFPPFCKAFMMYVEWIRAL